jgi:hypothetical protein
VGRRCRHRVDPRRPIPRLPCRGLPAVVDSGAMLLGPHRRVPRLQSGAELFADTESGARLARGRFQAHSERLGRPAPRCRPFGYRVDKETGAFTLVGGTGATQFFMDLAFDRDGELFGVTTTLNPSPVPAILYRIDLATGKATKVVNLVGSNYVMGLAFGRDGRLYATDFFQNPGLYLIDLKTGFETAIRALPFGFSSGLELANPGEDAR